MQKLKRFLGIIWMIVAVAAIVFLFYGAVTNINAAKGDVGKPLPWVIVIAVFTPVAVGLFVFGWYALRGEYDSGTAEQINAER